MPRRIPHDSATRWQSEGRRGVVIRIVRCLPHPRAAAPGRTNPSTSPAAPAFIQQGFCCGCAIGQTGPFSRQEEFYVKLCAGEIDDAISSETGNPVRSGTKVSHRFEPCDRHVSVHYENCLSPFYFIQQSAEIVLRSRYISLLHIAIIARIGQLYNRMSTPIPTFPRYPAAYGNSCRYPAHRCSATASR